MASKYMKGKKIRTIADFDKSKSEMFVVHLGKDMTRSRGFLISWQYRVLELHINQGHVFEAVKVGQEMDNES